MADAGFKLTVEGEKEFRKAISDVNAILKLNQAELQRVTAEYNASDKSIEAMTERQKDLGEVIDRQTAVVEQMEGELARLIDEYGENATGVVKMQAETEKARATLANLNAQFRSNAEEIEGASKMADDYGMSMEEIEAQISAAEAEIKAMDAAMQGNTESLILFGRRAEDAEKQVADLEKKHELLTSELAQQESKLEMLNSEMQEAVRLYGNQSKEVAEYRTKIAQTSTEMTELTRRIDENNREIEDAKDPAVDLKDVFSQISDITGVKIPEGLTAMVGDVGAVETAVLGGLLPAVAKVTVEVGKARLEFQQSASQLTKMAEETGLSTEEIQVLEALGGYFGVEADTLKDSLKDLRNNMYEAAGGNEELANKFRELNVEILDSDDNLRNVLDVYMDLSQAYFLMEDRVARLSKAEELLGESVNQSAAIATAGKTELLRVINLAYEKDMIMTDESIAKLDALDKRWKEFGMTVDGVMKKIQLANEEMADDRWWQKLLGVVFPLYNWYRGIDAAGSAWSMNNIVPYRGWEPTPYSGRGMVGPTNVTNNYNVEVSADEVKEFNDIVKMARDQRVTERMK